MTAPTAGRKRTIKAEPNPPSLASAGEPNAEQAIKLVMDMMAIPGKSGDEQAIAAFVVEELRAAGLGEDAIRFDKAHRQPPRGGARGPPRGDG